jgi:hypothetical protein
LKAASVPISDLHAEELRALAASVRNLERRVSALEQSALEQKEALPVELASASSSPDALPVERVELPPEVIPMAGFGLLGIAGAYLLRALSDIGALPPGAGAAVGIAYAALWLIFAARTPGARQIAVAARISTSVLIFCPLIWESTVRFKTVPVWVAAALVFTWCAAAQAISWRKSLKTIAAIVPAACAILDFALLLGTYALAPFTISLIAIAGAAEFAAFQHRAAGTRWLVAAVADMAVLTLTQLLLRPQGLPEGYAPVSIAMAASIQGSLALVYLTGAASRTLAHDRCFSILEIAQTVAAYALGIGGIVALTGFRFPLGVLSLAAGAACYFVAPQLPSARNRNVYAAFGLLLLASAPWLALTGNAQAIAWAALALAAARSSPDRSGAHAAVFFWLALIGSGAAAASTFSLYGERPPFPFGMAAVAGICGAVCYFAAGGLPALFIAGGLAVLAAGGAASVVRFPCAPTVILILWAVALAWMGAVFARRELIWLMYGFMGAAGIRVVTRDLPSATTLELVAPMLLFGAALVVLSRMNALSRIKPRSRQAGIGAGTAPHPQ